ncbi:N-acylethanolamine-hydrolyzing acid amidase-like [Tubulanus polymorphus]|uniref:N-acylethanolamine-hydrolyzing acid amidase-like n=1 Tax=Tubulanus polymorphus TaxID=672921 RepID=UPI003DA36615
MAGPWILRVFAIHISLHVFGGIVSCYERKVPTYTVDLDAPASDRWNEVVDDFQREIGMIAKAVREFVPVQWHSAFNQLTTKDFFPRPFGEELKGIAERAQVPHVDMLMVNLLYTLRAYGCTSIVAQSSTGKIWHGRNLDYGVSTYEKELITKLAIQVNFRKNGKIVYTGTSYAGYVGLPNGQRHGAFSISLNERAQGDVMENILMLRERAIPVPMLIRQVLSSPLNYRQALKTLSTTRISAPAYLTVGGILPGEGAVITRNHRKAVNVWELDMTINRWFVLETNYDHWKPPPLYDDRRTPGNKAMNDIGQKGFNGTSMLQVLSTAPILNPLTTFTAIMSAVDPIEYYTVVLQP